MVKRYMMFAVIIGCVLHVSAYPRDMIGAVYSAADSEGDDDIIADWPR